jgi:hypothetical protein
MLLNKKEKIGKIFQQKYSLSKSELEWENGCGLIPNLHDNTEMDSLYDPHCDVSLFRVFALFLVSECWERGFSTAFFGKRNFT